MRKEESFKFGDTKKETLDMKGEGLGLSMQAKDWMYFESLAAFDNFLSEIRGNAKHLLKK